MTTGREFNRELEQWLKAQASVKAPEGLHAASMQRVSSSRQRPAWLAGLRGNAFPARAGVSGHPALAAVLVVLALGLILVAAAVAGLFRSQPKPLGANGMIAYSVFEDKRRAGQTNFTYLVHADGSANGRIATGLCPTFSADGTAMTYRSDVHGGELWAAAPDGSSPRVLPITLEHAHLNGYALSPDGTRVAWFKPIAPIEFLEPDGFVAGFGSRNELWVTPVAGGSGTRIVPVSDLATESFSMPVWSPDGTTIAFEGHVVQPPAEGPGYRRAIYVVDASGWAVRRLTTRPHVYHQHTRGLAWSPDGRSIVYVGLPDGTPLPSGPVDDENLDVPPDLFVIGADGTGEDQLTSTSAFESRPSWSPDGARLGYLRSEDGETYELTVLPMAGRSPAGPPVRGPASYAFAWSPDGTTLLSIDGDTIRSVDAGLTGPPVTIVDLRAWPQLDPLHRAGYSTDSEHCPPSWQWLRP